MIILNGMVGGMKNGSVWLGNCARSGTLLGRLASWVFINHMWEFVMEVNNR